MLSFVERAILRVQDQSSQPVRRINRELVRLMMTAQRMRNTRIDLPGLDATTRDLFELDRALRSLPNAVRVAVELIGTPAARSELDRLVLPRVARVDVALSGEQTALATLARLDRPRSVVLGVDMVGDATALARLAALDDGRVIPLRFDLSGLPGGQVVPLRVELIGDTTARVALDMLSGPRTVPVKVALTGEASATTALELLTRDRTATVQMNLTGDSEALQLLTRLEQRRTAQIDVALYGLVLAQGELDRLAAPREALFRPVVVGDFAVNLTGVEAARAELDRLASPRTVPLRVTLSGETSVRTTLAMLATNRTVAFDLTGIATARGELSALNTQLTLIDSRRPVVHLNSQQVLTAINRVSRLAALLTTLPNGQVGVGVPPPQRTPTDGSAPQEFLAGIRDQARPYSLGRILLRDVAFEVSGEIYLAARNVVLTGFAAPIALDDARLRARTAGFDPETIAALEAEALRLSTVYQSTNQADILNASIEAAGAADPDTPEGFAVAAANMELIARSSQIIAGALGLGADAAAEQARLAFKNAQLQGTSRDPAAAELVIETALRATVASGGDLDLAEAVRAQQQLGALRPAMSEEAFLQILLARDEGGRASTAEYRMGFNDLIRGSLNDGDLAQQIAYGFRDAEGRSLVGDEFAQDPLGFAVNRLIPVLEQLGVDITDAVAVQNALDLELGFVDTGARVFTGMIVNRDQIAAEVARAQNVDLDAPIETPSVRMQAAAVRAQFENVAMQALEGFLPVVNTSLDLLNDSFANIAEGQATATDYLATAAAVVPAGIGASLAAMLETDSRPLGLAGLSLTSAAGALTSAAGALLTAAGAIGGLGTGSGAAAALLAFLRRVPLIGPTIMAVENQPEITIITEQPRPSPDFQGPMPPPENVTVLDTMANVRDWFRDLLGRAEPMPSQEERQLNLLLDELADAIAAGDEVLTAEIQAAIAAAQKPEADLERRAGTVKIDDESIAKLALANSGLSEVVSVEDVQNRARDTLRLLSAAFDQPRSVEELVKPATKEDRTSLDGPEASAAEVSVTAPVVNVSPEVALPEQRNSLPDVVIPVFAIPAPEVGILIPEAVPSPRNELQVDFEAFLTPMENGQAELARSDSRTEALATAAEDLRVKIVAAAETAGEVIRTALELATDATTGAFESVFVQGANQMGSAIRTAIAAAPIRIETRNRQIPTALPRLDTGGTGPF